MNKILIIFVISVLIAILYVNIEKSQNNDTDFGGFEYPYDICQNPQKSTLNICKNQSYLKSPIIGNEIVNKNEYDCVEAIDNYNNISQNRINILFAGFNYENFENYKFIIDSAIDIDSNNYGILSVEPFKSNKNKFNFWYVDKIEYIEPVNKALIGNKLVNLKCAFPITHPIGLINAPAADSKISSGSYGRYTTIGIREHENYSFIDCSAYDLNKDRCIDIKDAQMEKEIKKKVDVEFTQCFNVAWGCDFENPQEEKIIPYINDMKLLLHEFGHGFGLLGDEYVTPKASLNYPNDTTYFAGNCYPAISEKECLNNAPWKELFDEDCNKENSDCALTVSCYEGCTNYVKGIYRPTKTSIMNIPGKPFTYGPVNEKLICERMREFVENVNC